MAQALHQACSHVAAQPCQDLGCGWQAFEECHELVHMCAWGLQIPHYDRDCGLIEDGVLCKAFGNACQKLACKQLCYLKLISACECTSQQGAINTLAPCMT